MKDSMKGWKFLHRQGAEIVSGLGQAGIRTVWQVGEWQAVAPPTKACAGLNCSKHPSQAIQYVKGDVLAEVEYDGTVIDDGDKLTCERMRILEIYAWGAEESVMLAEIAAGMAAAAYAAYAANTDAYAADAAAYAAYAANAADAAYAAYAAADAADAAAYAADAANAAAAAYAANAAAAANAYAAAYAAYAAAKAAEWNQTIKACADIVRKHYPKPPKLPALHKEEAA